MALRLDTLSAAQGNMNHRLSLLCLLGISACSILSHFKSEGAPLCRLSLAICKMKWLAMLVSHATCQSPVASHLFALQLLSRVTHLHIAN